MVCYLLLLQAVLCPVRTIKHNCSAMSVTLEKKDHMAQRMFHKHVELQWNWAYQLQVNELD